MEGRGRRNQTTVSRAPRCCWMQEGGPATPKAKLLWARPLVLRAQSGFSLRLLARLPPPSLVP